MAYYSTDVAGNTEAVQANIIKLDSVMPVTTMTISSTAITGDYIAPVTLTLNAEDFTSGVANTLYQLNHDNWLTYNNNIIVSELPIGIAYRSEDAAGNVELTQSTTISNACTPLQSVNILGPHTALSGTAVILEASYVPTNAKNVTMRWNNHTQGNKANYIWQIGVHTAMVTATAVCGEPITATHTVTVTTNVNKPARPILLAPPNGVITSARRITLEWQAETNDQFIGYNVSVGEVIVTTTRIISPIELSLGIHTWTVRAFNTAGYSAWANVWSLEIISMHDQRVYLPLVIKSN
jgi:hypothetical protein